MSAQLRVLLIILCIGMAPLAGCAAAPGTAIDKSVSVNEQAALEATAIIQRAEATALVLQAQAKATALVQSAGALPVASATAAPSTVPRAAGAARVSTPPSAPSPSAAATETASISQVELLVVDFGAEGRYIHVAFRAPPRVARQWRQGNVYVVDEATGTIYNGIPVAPIIGPLIAHPIHDGQIGYVMPFNTPPGIHPGSIVTVVLGDFKQEHVTVTGD